MAKSEGILKVHENPSSLTTEEIFKNVSSSPNGLSAEEAKNRLSLYGANVIPQKKKKSKLKIFLGNFKNSLVYALFAAALFAFVIGEYLDVIVILGVVLLNAVIGYIQEIKAQKDIEALKKLSSYFVNVIRGGNLTEVSVESLVVGDVVVLSEGDRVPADGRVIKSNSLLLNEAVLTGESELVLKTDQKISTENEKDPDNMVFQGTIVAEGKGQFVVLATGADTRFGKIAVFAQKEEEKTPIEKKIAKFAKQIGVVVLLVCALVLILGVLEGYGIIEMIQFSISLAVSAIPEGLPIAVTIALVLGAKRMAKKNAIVRNMMAVETLGTTTVIATDKTGTLTHNELKVVSAHNSRTYEFEEGNENSGYYMYHGKRCKSGDLRRLLTAGAVCNNAEYLPDEERIIGDATDAAILENAESCGIKKEYFKKLNEVPFSSEKRYMAVLAEEDGEKKIFIKGAPEEIIARCSYSLVDGKKERISKKKREEMLEDIERLSKNGLRLVAAGDKDYSKDFKSSLNDGFTYLGTLALKDTYRPGVKEAIEKCKKAGIRIVMLTGDHLGTAIQIAKKLGIIKRKGEAVLSSNISEHGIKLKDTENVSVFARILPEHKYKVVEYFKNKGEIVAMTGDGVNDVPALRKADIGISMGKSGTDAAREASDLVLADDNFATIVSAVEEGRTIFANLRKSILYLVSTSVGEVLTVIGALLLALPLPITALQILWINLITDTSATIPLGVEEKEEEHLKMPPRNLKDGIISPLMIRRSILVGFYMAAVALYIFENNRAFGLDYARTVTFLFLSVSQWFNALNCRSEKKSVFSRNPFSNSWLNIGIAGSFAAQVAIMYLPRASTLFNFVPVGFDAWLIPVVLSFGVIFLIEIDKFVGNKIEDIKKKR